MGAVRVPGSTNHADVFGDNCSPVGRTDGFNNWSYLASTDYRINPDVMVYGKFSKGYRSGGQNLRATNPLIFVPFGPEIVYEAEAGFKSELLDRRLRAYLSGAGLTEAVQLGEPTGRDRGSRMPPRFLSEERRDERKVSGRQPPSGDLVEIAGGPAVTDHRARAVGQRAAQLRSEPRRSVCRSGRGGPIWC